MVAPLVSLASNNSAIKQLQAHAIYRGQHLLFCWSFSPELYSRRPQPLPTRMGRHICGSKRGIYLYGAGIHPDVYWGANNDKIQDQQAFGSRSEMRGIKANASYSSLKLFFLVRK